MIALQKASAFGASERRCENNAVTTGELHFPKDSRFKDRRSRVKNMPSLLPFFNPVSSFASPPSNLKMKYGSA